MSSTLRSNWADEAAPTSEAWWETFFKGPFGELQLLPLPVDTTQQDVERVTATLGGGTHRILDAPCGAGRHSLELARRGHQVVGIDFNPQVLEAARSRAQAEALLVDFRLQDLRRLRPSETFDAVTNLWTSFGYFSDAENQALLKNLVACLRPGGWLFLDVLVTESLSARYSPRHWSWRGEGEQRVRVCQEQRFDCLTGRVHTTWSFLRDGQEQTRESSIRVYSCTELVALLKAAGLTDFRCLGDNGGAFTFGDQRLWLEARKPL